MGALEEIARASTAADGAEPLDEGAWRRLRHHADELDIQLEPGAGFTVVDGELLHLVVTPRAREQGLGTRLLGRALDSHPEVGEAWSHGDHPAAAVLARRTGFERVRELWVMRRPLAGYLDSPAPGNRTFPSLQIRGYGPADAAELLRVNAAAFAHHPEQGAMDEAELAERMAEPWFDPADLLVAVDADDAGHMFGFHWTKRHSDSLGEVYVVAIDPEVHGKGLGRTLVDLGLRHLAQLGLDDVLLYVESDNVAAVRLYEGLGFTHAVADTHVMYERAKAVSEPGS
jgi:mycothiol synthase